jgi:hypothetical protein
LVVGAAEESDEAGDAVEVPLSAAFFDPVDPGSADPGLAGGVAADDDPRASVR